MSLEKDLDVFFKSTKQAVFIEAEAKTERMHNFLTRYNSYYAQKISKSTEGIIILQEDADKWGLELRLYFYDKTGIPTGVKVTHNDQYRGCYSYRINDNELIKKLFNYGYRIGINKGEDYEQ